MERTQSEKRISGRPHGHGRAPATGGQSTGSAYGGGVPSRRSAHSANRNGSSTLCAAVSEATRLNAWKTKPMRSRPVPMVHRNGVAGLRRTTDGDSVSACGGARLVASRSAPELRVCGSDSAKYGLRAPECLLSAECADRGHSSFLLRGPSPRRPCVAVGGLLGVSVLPAASRQRGIAAVAAGGACLPRGHRHVRCLSAAAMFALRSSPATQRPIPDDGCNLDGLRDVYQLSSDVVATRARPCRPPPESPGSTQLMLDRWDVVQERDRVFYRASSVLALNQIWFS